MKTILKAALIFLIPVFMCKVEAQQGSITKDSTLKAAPNTTLLAINQDTAKKIKGTYQKISNQTGSRSIPAWQDLEKKNNNPRIAELNKEISQLVGLYKAGKGPGEIKKNGPKYYSDLTESEKKYYRSKVAGSNLRGRDKIEYDRNKERFVEQYYNSRYAKNMNVRTNVKVRASNDPREQTANEIRRKLGELFDLREDEKRDEIRKLEKQISALESKLNERRESKKQIVDGRLKELIGQPNHLKW